MIEYVEDRYEWVTTREGGSFRLVEHEPMLINMPALRVDVQRQRVTDGWLLVASHPSEENAQLFVSDLWSRTRTVGAS